MVLGFLGVNIPSYLPVFLCSIILLLAGTEKGHKCNISYGVSKNSILIIVFTVWFAISSVISVSEVYSKNKLFYFIYNTIIPILVIKISLILYKPRVIGENVIVKYAIYSSIISVLFLFFLGESSQSGRVSVSGVENPIWVSRFFGMLFVIIFITSRWTKSNMLILFVSLFSCVLGLFISGSRTPILAVMLVVAINLAKNKGLIYILPVFVFGAVLFVFGVSYSDNYIFDLDFYSLYHRFDYIKNTFGVSWNPIIGAGLGSFGVYFLGEDVVFYPHNLLVEVFFELGLLGLIIISFMVMLFVRGFKGSLFEYLCIYFFILSMTSGDIPGNNYLFITFFSSYVFDAKCSNNQYEYGQVAK
jgi:hypothetical protein